MTVHVHVEITDGKNDFSHIVPSSERIFSLSSFAVSCDFSNSPTKKGNKKDLIKNNYEATHEPFTNNKPRVLNFFQKFLTIFLHFQADGS